MASLPKLPSDDESEPGVMLVLPCGTRVSISDGAVQNKTGANKYAGGVSKKPAGNGNVNSCRVAKKPAGKVPVNKLPKVAKKPAANVKVNKKGGANKTAGTSTAAGASTPAVGMTIESVRFATIKEPVNGCFGRMVCQVSVLVRAIDFCCSCFACCCPCSCFNFCSACSFSSITSLHMFTDLAQTVADVAAMLLCAVLWCAVTVCKNEVYWQCDIDSCLSVATLLLPVAVTAILAVIPDVTQCMVC
jgi:hypothetical protein